MGKSPIPVADRFVQQSSVWKLIPEAGGTGCCGCWQRRTCCMSLFFYEYEFHLQQVSVLYVWSSPVSPPVTPFCSLPHGSSGVGRGSVGNVCLCCALGSFSWKWKQIEGSHTLSQIFYLWSSPQALAGITCLRSLSLLFLKGWLGSVGTWWVPCQVPEHCYGFKILTRSLLVSLGCLLPSKFRFLPTLCQGTGAEQSIPVLCPWGCSQHTAVAPAQDIGWRGELESTARLWLEKISTHRVSIGNQQGGKATAPQWECSSLKALYTIGDTLEILLNYLFYWFLSLVS